MKEAMIYRKIRFMLHELNVHEGRVVYQFYAFTRRGVYRKMRKYFDE